MTTYLSPSRVLDPVKWDHVTVVTLGHIEACKHLGCVAVQISGVPQLVRDAGKERRESCGTTSRRRRVTRGWHRVV